MVWDLYSAFYKGFPIENLRPLLVSDDLDVSGSGALLANELGDRMGPLIDEVLALAEHTHTQARSDALYALQACARPCNVNALGRLVLALDDPGPFVHRAAMQFIIMARYRCVKIGAEEAKRQRPTSPFQAIWSLIQESGNLKWSPEQITKDEIAEFIHHPAPVVRRFGVGLAARPKLVVDVELLDIARGCEDSEGVGMVDYILRSPLPSGARVARLTFVDSTLEKDSRSRRNELDV
jgi:hypothetical protein